MTLPYILHESDQPSPLLLSSPHSGHEMPPDFHPVCGKLWLRKLEDFYVDELISNAPATIVAARYPRAYVDLNRGEEDFDGALVEGLWPFPIRPSAGALKGMGVVRRICAMGVPLYDKPLKVEEVKGRIENIYRPYHQILQQIMEQKRDTFGKAVLIDCHSMPAIAVSQIVPQPDIVLGDREGTSAGDDVVKVAKAGLERLGYCVAVNNPYKGVEILRRHGKPAERLHAIQMEINRQLYVDEDNFEKTGNFPKLQKNLTSFFVDFVKAIL